MALEPKESAAVHFPIPNFLFQVETSYLGLISAADPDSNPDAEPNLGGQLLYTGELDEEGRALIVAANIAGAASLAASADETAQKQALRDGVVDFLVNSLDEALRILKNEIRKRDTVAVCVAQAPDIVKREMRERGVRPDLVRPADERSQFGYQGAIEIPRPVLGNDMALLTWSVAAAPALWLPKLDAIALECLPQKAWPARRWLRLAPRYLGRIAKGTRLLHCDRPTAEQFIDKVRGQVDRREIAVQVGIQVTGQGAHEQHDFSPAVDSQTSS